MKRIQNTEGIVLSKEKKNKTSNYIVGVGRRKESIARVRLYSKGQEVILDGQVIGKGEIYVNGKPIQQYFSGISDQAVYANPLSLTNVKDKYTFTIKVSGGGKKGQLDAVVLGLSKALQSIDSSLRPILKKHGFLTRDARVRQRRKVGMGGKARRKKQSPKR